MRQRSRAYQSSAAAHTHCRVVSPPKWMPRLQEVHQQPERIIRQDKYPETIALVSKDNPIEMLDAYDIKDGECEMYIAYGGRDQFNLDAQVESFLYRCREKGITVAVGYDPKGKHDVPTALKLLPGMLEWLKPRLEPYSPR